MLNRQIMSNVYKATVLSKTIVFADASHAPKKQNKFLKSIAVLFLLMIFGGQLAAQEICNNGIDDDNDGYVDCFDSDCSGSFFCSGNFFGGPVLPCQFVPPPAPPFQMGVMWSSDSTTIPMDARRTPLVADIDLDGMPEVISGNPGMANGLYILNGATGALERTINAAPFSVFSDAFAVGDIDNDGFGEIVLVADNSVGRQLYCYEHNGNLKWTSSSPVGFALTDHYNVPAIADFNYDGIPEIFVGNQIFNGANGNLIVSGSSTGARGQNPGSPAEPFPMAADVLPNGFCPDCQGLELVCGNVVYSVDILSGTLTQRTTIAGMSDGLTSLGDIDQDGDIDAVVVGQSAGRGIVYVWDLQTGTQIGSTFQIDNATNAGGNVTISGGIATVGDLDGNGTPDIGVVGNDVFVALRYNAGTSQLQEIWSLAVQDASERTGSSLFDFEGDGAVEVVYRDETTLRVLDGATGTVKFSTPCSSASRMELPVIADVDNDGAANIVCHCGQNVKSFQPTTVPWVAARNIWNQRGYFVVNIKDNLRIPQQQQRQELGYPSGSPVNYPFNAFLKQVSTLADDGSFSNPASDDQVTILNPSTDVNLGPCQDGIQDSIGIRLSVTNGGSIAFPAGTMVSFYNGNPYLAGATLIRTYAIATSVPAGGSLQLPMVNIADQGGTFDLYYQINDDGSNAIPITSPAFGHQECNFNNNMGMYSIVNCGNTPPVIDTFGLVTDTILFSSNEDAVVTYCVSASDPEFQGYDVTAIIGSPGLGSISGLNDGDSCFTLTPVLDTTGTAIFQIIICDNGNVSLCDTAVFVWTVLPGNDPPVALDDSISTLEDVPVSIPVTNNDTDPEGNPLSLTVIGGPSHGSAVVSGTNIDYTPAPNYFGMDTLWYQVCDNFLPPGCDTAMVVITVISVNDIPVALNDSLSFPNDTTTITIAVQNNDSDVEPGPLTTTLLCLPTNGTAVVVGNDIQYTPDSTFIGLDTLCYTICDTGTPQGCDTGYVFFNIFNGNEAPIAVVDYDTTTLEDTLIFNVLTNDSDPNGHAFSITSLDCGPYHGTVTYDSITGVFVYVPAVAYLGPDTICYVICDVPPAGPAFCDTAYVFLEVLSDNRPPVAVIDTMTIPFNMSGTINVLTNDSDPDGDSIFATIIQLPANGVALLSNGIATYTPNPNFTGTDFFCYQLCDNGLPSLCDTACVTFYVQAPNELVVPNGFSPNGDGVNDILEITGIELFTNSEFYVFNRYGTVVFDAKAYQNDWNGTFKGEQLPEGTYFYKLDPGDGSGVITGYIHLYR